MRSGQVIALGIAMLLADVVGHGIAAAMLAVAIRTCFNAHYAAGHRERSLERLVESISAALSPFGDTRFATLIAIEIRRSAREYSLRYINAGHPSGAVLTPDGAELTLSSTGPLVSPAFAGGQDIWETREVRLPKNATVVMWSDGLNDAESIHGRFADSNLQDTLSSSGRLGTAVVRSLLSRMRSHMLAEPPEDDIAIAAISAGLPGLA